VEAGLLESKRRLLRKKENKDECVCFISFASQGIIIPVM